MIMKCWQCLQDTLTIHTTYNTDELNILVLRINRSQVINKQRYFEEKVVVIHRGE